MGTVQIKPKNKNSGNLIDQQKSKITIDIDMKREIPVNLLQLTNWSFSEIRTAIQIYERLSESPMVDSFIFHKMIPLGKKNCDIIFAKLSRGKKYISVYEIIGILIVTSFQTYSNKFQFFQLLFDFNHRNKIQGKQFMCIYYSIYYGYCRLSGNQFSDFDTLDKFGQALFFPGEEQSDFIDKDLTLRRFIQEYQANPKIYELFNRFEHPEHRDIKEDFIIYTKSEMKKYNKAEVEKIFRILSKIYRENNYQEIQMIENNKQLRRQNRRDSCYNKLIEEKNSLNKKLALFIKSPSKVKNKKSYSLAKLVPISPPKNKQSTTFLTPQRSKYLSTIAMTQRSSKEPSTFRVKKIQNRQSPKKSLIFLCGKTHNKRQIFDSINYFKSLSENGSLISIKQFFKKFSKKSYLKKQVSSLFKFLDYQQSGEITLEDYFKSIYPGVTKDDLVLLKKWYDTYQQIYEANNLDLNQIKIIEMSDERILPYTTLDRLKQIFGSMDNGDKGYLNFQDLRKSYKRGFTATELESLMKQYGKNGNIYLSGLCKLLLPIGWTIQGVNLDEI